MKKRLMSGLIVLALSIGMFSSVDVNAATAPAVVYRLYNSHSGEHFYTKNTVELKTLENAGWKYEGISFIHDDSGVPIYRLYNPNVGVHHYTRNEGEKNTLANKYGWKYEGVAFKISATGVPVHRLYNPNNGLHHYTSNEGEKNTLVTKYGWKYENIAWYTADVAKSLKDYYESETQTLETYKPSDETKPNNNVNNTSSNTNNTSANTSNTNNSNASTNANTNNKPTSNTSNNVEILNETDIYNAIIAMKDKYPDGSLWDFDSVYNSRLFGEKDACDGFAWMLSDAAFGDRPDVYLTYNLDHHKAIDSYLSLNIDFDAYSDLPKPSLKDIRVGDLLTIYQGGINSHIVIVLSKEDDGVIVAEGNSGGKVRWGRKIKYSALDMYLMDITSRYPDVVNSYYKN